MSVGPAKCSGSSTVAADLREEVSPARDISRPERRSGKRVSAKAVSGTFDQIASDLDNGRKTEHIPPPDEGGADLLEEASRESPNIPNTTLQAQAPAPTSGLGFVSPSEAEKEPSRSGKAAPGAVVRSMSQERAVDIPADRKRSSGSKRTSVTAVGGADQAEEVRPIAICRWRVGSSRDIY